MNDEPEQKKPVNPLGGLERLAGGVVKPRRKVSRRSLVGGVTLGAVVLGAGRFVWDRSSLQGYQRRGPSLRWLGERHARTLEAVAAVMAGPVAAQALQQGHWDPVVSVDAMLDLMDAEQRKLLLLGLTIFEQAQLSWFSFSSSSKQTRINTLLQWKNSDKELQQGIWGFLHASLCTSYNAGSDAWGLMGYEGPCVASGAYAGRAPGQTVTFDWDEAVP